MVANPRPEPLARLYREIGRADRLIARRLPHGAGISDAVSSMMIARSATRPVLPARSRSFGAGVSA